MLRVSTRKHAAGSLTFFSHGLSYETPELCSNDAKFTSVTLSSFQSIRDRWQTDRVANFRRGGQVIRHGEHTKQDEKIQEINVESMKDHQHSQHHTIISEKAQCSPKDEISIRKEIITQTHAITKPLKTHKWIGISQPGLFIKFTFEDSHQEHLVQCWNKAL